MKHLGGLPAISIVFAFPLVELHSKVGRLEVESDHLTSGIPEYLQTHVSSDAYSRQVLPRHAEILCNKFTASGRDLS
jgi:hypothetical protein